MLDKPNIKDETLITALHERYGLPVETAEFLQLGHDSNAGVYRVQTSDGTLYFAKVKKGAFDAASAAIPRYLKDHGLSQAVAPIPTHTHELWTRLEEYTLLLYPYIDGQTGMALGLTNQQWVEYGAILKQLHATTLPGDLLALTPSETFIPQPHLCGVVKQLLGAIEDRTYTDPYQHELAAFWNERRAEIQRIVERAESLGRALQQRKLPFVLCHADIHTNNILIDTAGQLFVVDWDQPIQAPKERDLMFVIDTPIGGLKADPQQEQLFFQGYGPIEIDWLAIAYYRYEWAIEDMGGFAEAVFLRDDVSNETKAHEGSLFQLLFQPGYIIEAAYASERHLPRLRQK